MSYKAKRFIREVESGHLPPLDEADEKHPWPGEIESLHTSFVPKRTIDIPMPKLPDPPRDGMHFCFGDIVVVEGNLIGVVVKSWTGTIGQNPTGPNHDVYVREFNAIVNYPEKDMQRYMVRHKYLDDKEVEYQKNAIAGR